MEEAALSRIHMATAKQLARLGVEEQMLAMLEARLEAEAEAAGALAAADQLADAAPPEFDEPSTGAAPPQAAHVNGQRRGPARREPDTAAAAAQAKPAPAPAPRPARARRALPPAPAAPAWARERR